jgi:hypothetical protein
LNHQPDALLSTGTANTEGGKNWVVAQPIDSGYADNDTEATANKDYSLPPNANQATADSTDALDHDTIELNRSVGAIPETWRVDYVDDSTALSGSWMLELGIN